MSKGYTETLNEMRAKLAKLVCERDHIEPTYKALAEIGMVTASVENSLTMLNMEISNLEYTILEMEG